MEFQDRRWFRFWYIIRSRFWHVTLLNNINSNLIERVTLNLFTNIKVQMSWKQIYNETNQKPKCRYQITN